MSDTLRWLAVGGVVFLGSFTTNAATVVRYLTSKRTGSMVPFVGGVAGALGLALSPNVIPSGIWWLPLLVDPGSAPLVVAALVRLAGPGSKKDDKPPS